MALRVPLLAGVAMLLATLTVALVLHLRSSGPFLGAISVGTLPSAVALDPRIGRALVTNSTADTVTVLDTSTGAVVRTVAVGPGPVAVGIDTLTGLAFVLNSAGPSVSVLDAARGMVLRTVLLLQAKDLRVDERLGRVYVVGWPMAGPGDVAILDAGNGRVRTATPVGTVPRGLAVDDRTRHLFVTNLVNGTVDMLDAASGRLLRVERVGLQPFAVAVDVPASRVFVTDVFNNSVSMLDARSGAVLRTVPVGDDPANLAVDARTARVFVLNDGDGTVSMLDTRTGAVLRTVTVSAVRPDIASEVIPSEIAVDQRRGRVFVLNGSATTSAGTLNDGSVSVLDAATGRVLRTVTVGRSPAALALDEATARLFVVNSGPSNPQHPDVWGPSWLRRWLPWLPRPARQTANGSVTVLDTSRW